MGSSPSTNASITVRVKGNGQRENVDPSNDKKNEIATYNRDKSTTDDTLASINACIAISEEEKAMQENVEPSKDQVNEIATKNRDKSTTDDTLTSINASIAINVKGKEIQKNVEQSKDQVNETASSNRDGDTTDDTLLYSDDELSLLFNKLRADAEKMLSQGTGQTDGVLNETVLKVLDFCLFITVVAIKNKKLRDFANLLLSIGFINPLCEIAIEILKDWNKDIHESERKAAYAALSISWNVSDVSQEVRRELAIYPHFLETLRKTISSYDCNDQIEIQPNISDFKIVKASVNIVNNTSRCQDNIERLRELDFISVCQPYLYSQDNVVNLAALALLANLVNEEECDIISAAKNCVQYLLSSFKSALDSGVWGWSVIECGSIIRNLARNDANKRMLVELGAFPLLVKMGQTGNKEEQYESLMAIWALCFDTENQNKVVKEKELGVVEFLMDTKKETDDNKIKKACHGALWTIRKAMKMSGNKVYTEYAIQMESVLQWTKPKISIAKDEGVKGQRDNVGHVMISYNWADKELMKTIRDILKQRGFKVWIDIDHMGGSTVEAMADAIEKSEVVLMCMSQKYKNSHNCRNEAEYAFERKKTIIPLKTELDYKPDGWLGFICGSKLFYDFSEKYDFQDKITELIDGIQKKYDGCKSSGGHLSEKPERNVESVPGYVPQVGYKDTHMSSVTPIATAQSGMKMTAIQAVKQWSDVDVKAWKEKNDLHKVLPTKITAGEIALLLRMKKESPDFFYRCVHELLKLKGLHHMSKLIWALDEINP